MITALILLLIAGLCNAWMDKISFHWDRVPRWIKRHWRFWDPDVSWVNKWDMTKTGQVERFPFSSTALVFLTDGWHLLKAIMLFCISAAMVLLSDTPWWWYFIFHGTFSLGFAINYYDMKNVKFKLWMVAAVIILIMLLAVIFNAYGITSWDQIF